MATYKKRPDFFTSEDGIVALQKLKDMVGDSAYTTKPSYGADKVLYPDNLVPFVDKHMSYLRDHPKTDPMLYISNLRLMTRVR